jgi:shikimate 5-dehydrogenase
MENKTLRWCEISDACEKLRFESLSEAMKLAGHENVLEFIEVDEAGFEKALADAESRFDGIRLGGNASEWIFTKTDRMPSLTATLQSADAVVIEKQAAGSRWWSRNYLFDGLNRAMAASATTPDISGAVFILGARPLTRVLVASWARIGFNRFNIVDPDETKAEALVESLKKKLFGLEIHSVQRHYMTQLPGIHSVAANVLPQGADEGTLLEIAYFNFLKPGGIWLDLPLTPFNTSLNAEAVAVGASILEPSEVLAITDSIWLEECFGIKIDIDALKLAVKTSREKV